MEVQRGDGTWGPVGSVGEVEPPGSLSSDEAGGRRVILFGWYDDTPGVWESVAGADVETSAVRGIATLGLNRLSDLHEPYYIEIYRRGLRMPVRFTLQETS